MSNSTDKLFPEELAIKIKNRTLVDIEISRLTPNPVNPPERTASNSSFLSLKKGIRELGVLETIHYCGDTMTLINGHRRAICAKANNIESLSAYRYDGLSKIERDILFKHLNTTSNSYSGSQMLHTFLCGGTVEDRVATECNSIIEIGNYEKIGIGMEYLQTIRDKRKSPGSFLSGISMYCKVIGDQSMREKNKVLYWMLYVGTAHRIKSLISLKCPAHLIKKAVNTKKPVMGTWVITAG